MILTTTDQPQYGFTVFCRILLLMLVEADKLSYEDKDRIIAPYYDIELETGVVINTLIMSRKEWDNRPFPTPFYVNVTNEGIIVKTLLGLPFSPKDWSPRRAAAHSQTCTTAANAVTMMNSCMQHWRKLTNYTPKHNIS